jgi:hypothetical protein
MKEVTWGLDLEHLAKFVEQAVDHLANTDGVRLWLTSEQHADTHLQPSRLIAVAGRDTALIACASFSAAVQ